MILELDCGNSFIKWRVVNVDQVGVVAGGVVDSDEMLILTLSALGELTLKHCRLVSVRSVEETAKLTCAVTQAFGVACAAASPARTLAGVKNGYEDFERLGLDRWLALVGAYCLSGKACLVIDLGTAVTSDFVDGDGQHLGGFICPGLPLMRDQLRTHTRRIRYDYAAAERALGKFTPGRSTAEAVERGCSLMLRSFVASQLVLAREYWGNEFLAFVTGGDANVVKDVVPDAKLIPDLVFVGLALACPLS